MTSVAVEEVLLVLKIAFLVLLYLFIWRIVRTASRDVRVPQDSLILAPSRSGGLRRESGVLSGRLVVLKSPALAKGDEHVLDSSALTVGRSSENDVPLGGDEYASSRHARFEPRRDGIWVEDVGSTNGTFVNGIKLTHARKLALGDVIRVGETDFRFEG